MQDRLLRTPGCCCAVDGHYVMVKVTKQKLGRDSLYGFSLAPGVV